MLKSNNIGLVAIDLDNTLLRDDKTISQEDLKSLKRLIDNDIEVVIASGRFEDSHRLITKDLGLRLEDKTHIAEGGGLIYQGKDREILGILSNSDYQEILDRLRKEGLTPFISDGEFVYYEKEGPLNDIYGRDTKTPHSRLRKVEDLSLIKNPIKFILYCTDGKEFQKIKDLNTENTKAFISAVHLAEITSKQLDKWEALKKIIQDRNLSAEQVAAIGDSGNDLEMIKNAGLGLAVSNALPEVKANADHVAVNDNNSNAVTELIENYILKNA